MKSRHVIAAAGATLSLVLAAGCATHQTFVDYSGSAMYSTDNVGNVPYVEVGPAAASERGFFWEGCQAMAGEAVAQLKQVRDSYGATAVSTVRWLNHADGSYTEKPICTTGWGWALLPPVIGVRYGPVWKTRICDKFHPPPTAFSSGFHVLPGGS